MRADLPRIRPRSHRRSESQSLSRDWKELVTEAEVAFDARNEEEMRRRGVARREVPVVLDCPPTPVVQLERDANSRRSSSSSLSARDDLLASLQDALGVDRLAKADARAPRESFAIGPPVANQAPFLSLDQFPSPPLAGAEAFINTKSNAPSLAERRAKMIERLVLRPPSAWDDDSPSPSPGENSDTPGSVYEDEHVQGGDEDDLANETAGAHDLSRELAKLMTLAQDVEQRAKLSLSPIDTSAAAVSRFSPITDSSAANSSFESDSNSSSSRRSPASVKMERSPNLGGAIGSAMLALSTRSAQGELILDGLAIDGLSAAQRCSASQWAAQLPAHLPLASPAESLADPMQAALSVPGSSTSTADSFSPFTASVASFSTDPSSVDDDQQQGQGQGVVVPEGMKWKWEQSGVFPPSAPASDTPSYGVPSPRPSLAPSVSNEHGSVLGYYIRDAGRSPSSIWDDKSTASSPDASVREDGEGERAWRWIGERTKMPASELGLPVVRVEPEQGEVVEWGYAL